MLRVVALLTAGLIAFGAAAPAIAACRRAGVEHGCCCSPSKNTALCAPDCCGTIKRAAEPEALPTLVARDAPLAFAVELPRFAAPSPSVLVAPRHAPMKRHQGLAPPIPLRI